MTFLLPNVEMLQYHKSYKRWWKNNGNYYKEKDVWLRWRFADIWMHLHWNPKMIIRQNKSQNRRICCLNIWKLEFIKIRANFRFVLTELEQQASVCVSYTKIMHGLCVFIIYFVLSVTLYPHPDPQHLVLWHLAMSEGNNTSHYRWRRFVTYFHSLV